MTEKEYREHPAINQSLLGKLAVSPKGVDKEEGEKGYFTMGSLVDCKLTDPDSFNEKYYVMTTKKPSSEMMLAYVNEYLVKGDHARALIVSGYKADPTIVAKSSKDGLSKWQKEGKAYYDACVLAGDKQIISFEEEVQANQICNILKENDFTGKYFDKADNMYQKAIIFKYHGRECKALLDIIHIDHDSSTIRPVDLKTTGKSVLSFRRSYLDYKYYIQAAFYTVALHYALKNNPEFSDYADYDVLPFQFIVQETNMFNPPHIFEVDEEDMFVAEYGGIVDGAGYEIRGFQQLRDELEEHRDTGQWDYRHEVYENSGVISLKALAKADQI
jgi:hypothetical protein